MQVLRPSPSGGGTPQPGKNKGKGKGGNQGKGRGKGPGAGKGGGKGHDGPNTGDRATGGNWRRNDRNNASGPRPPQEGQAQRGWKPPHSRGHSYRAVRGLREERPRRTDRARDDEEWERYIADARRERDESRARRSEPY